MPRDLPTLCSRFLATLTRAAKSAGSHNVEPDGDTRGRVLTVTAHPSSVAQRSFRRQTPEVGARCVNHARRDLCGGVRSNAYPYRDRNLAHSRRSRGKRDVPIQSSVAEVPSLVFSVVGNRADLKFPVRPLPRRLDPVRVAEGANPNAIDLAVAGDGRGPGHVAAPLGVLLRPVV
jgi:hypothetical protein